VTLAERAPAALADEHLQQALGKITNRYRQVRSNARGAPDTGARKDFAASVRREILADLDGWIDTTVASLERVGAIVHRCATAADAAATVVEIARREGSRLAVKVKSMATEEIHLNAALEAIGVEVVEGDLGEYIVQIAGERPSHIITPAIHKTLRQVADLFEPLAGAPLPVEREALCAFAREHLRAKFLAADLGITGANFVAADTGTIVLVTNEGNGRMATTVPRVQVSVVPIDKIVPRLADLGAVLPLLTEHATAQSITAYLSMTTGPRRPGELDGPEVLHVVLLDGHRRDLIGTPYEEMLACIRCGACLNACPVYGKVGGHAYDSVYPGPMGSVLTPLLSGGTEGRDLPHASSLCGACTEICPVGIPLADLLVRLRSDLRTPGPVVPARAPSSPTPVVPRSAVAAFPSEGGRSAVEAAAAGAGASAVPGGSGRSEDAPPRAPAAGFPWPGAGAPLRHRRSRTDSLGWMLWAQLWRRPVLYRATLAVGRAVTWRRSGWCRSVPGARGWTATRDLPSVTGPGPRRRRVGSGPRP
jgi:L-lactate dehydrogenase complex protein LldF